MSYGTMDFGDEDLEDAPAQTHVCPNCGAAVSRHGMRCPQGCTQALIDRYAAPSAPAPHAGSEQRERVVRELLTFRSVMMEAYCGAERDLAGEAADRILAALAPTEQDAPNADDDTLADLVSRFSAALLAKLRDAEEKYGHNDAWRRTDWMDVCRAELRRHTEKGDPRDVAAYCAFLWHHGESTALRAERPEVERELRAVLAAIEWGGTSPGDGDTMYRACPFCGELDPSDTRDVGDTGHAQSCRLAAALRTKGGNNGA